MVSKQRASTVLLIGFGLIIGYISYHKHVNSVIDLDKIWQGDENSKLNDVNAYATEQERLFVEITPILICQLVTLVNRQNEK